MGTRADFYVGRGKQAEWLGSIAWDGYPRSINKAVLDSKTEEEYREAIGIFLTSCKDATFPEMGWPWPWEDSRLTDYAYAFDAGKVWSCPFGHGWCDPFDEPEDVDGSAFWNNDKPTEFPNMSEVQSIARDVRSGIIII